MEPAEISMSGRVPAPTAEGRRIPAARASMLVATERAASVRSFRSENPACGFPPSFCFFQPSRIISAPR